MDPIVEVESLSMSLGGSMAGDEQPASDGLQYEREWVDSCPHLSLEDLEAQLAAQQEENGKIQRETEMYEHYLAKSTAKAQQEETDNNEGEAATGQGNRRRRSRQMRPGARVVLEQLQLTSQQKCDVAASSLDELKFKLDKERSVYDDQLCDIQAAIEEEDMREQELRMLHFDFQREIVEGAVSRANGKVLGEAVEHYFESRQKARAMLIEQLQLKDGRLKVAQQMRQREEVGEVLHEVDFRQLQIENTQIVEKTKDRNAEMLRLKLSAGTLLQVLNDHNRQLQRLRATGASLSDEISAREGLLARLAAETAGVEEQRQAAQATHDKLREAAARQRAAPVLDYVREAAAVDALQRDAAAMERRVAVARGELRRLRNTSSSAPTARTGTVAFGSTLPQVARSSRWG